MADSTEVEKVDVKPEEVVELDPEEQAYQDAVKAAEAEESGGEKQEADLEGELKDKLEGKPDEAKPDADPDKDKQSDEQKLVPLPALKAERIKNQQLREQNAFLLGKLEANNAPELKQDQEPEPTPEEKLKAIRDERIRLAEQHDDGELSSADWERQKQGLEDQEHEVRQAMQQPPVVTQAPTQDYGLEQHLVNLESQYDGLDTLTDNQAAHLRDLVIEQAAASGDPIQSGAAGTARLREEIAELATRLLPDQIQRKQPEAQQKQGLSDKAKDRDAAITKAQSAPPDVSNMGARDTALPASDEEMLAKMEGMTEEDRITFLEANPRFVEQVMGSTL